MGILASFESFPVLKQGGIHALHASGLTLNSLTESEEGYESNNGLFYSCVLGCQAFEQEWGYSWPCYDTNLAPF